MVTSRSGGGFGLRQRRSMRGFAQAIRQNFVRFLHQFADALQMRLDLVIILGKDRGEMIDNRLDIR